MRVLKFGGSSVATTEAMERSAAIVKDAQGHGRVGVVVSALRGITTLAWLPSTRAAHDTAMAWLPALTATSPRARAS